MKLVEILVTSQAFLVADSNQFILRDPACTSWRRTREQFCRRKVLARRFRMTWLQQFILTWSRHHFFRLSSWQQTACIRLVRLDNNAKTVSAVDIMKRRTWFSSWCINFTVWENHGLEETSCKLNYLHNLHCTISIRAKHMSQNEWSIREARRVHYVYYFIPFTPTKTN